MTDWTKITPYLRGLSWQLMRDLPAAQPVVIGFDPGIDMGPFGSRR